MRYKIIIIKNVKKFLSSHEFLAKKFFTKIQFLSENDFKNIDIKKLNGKINHYRLRIGKYKFLYEIINKDIIIYFYEANSRGDIY